VTLTVTLVASGCDWTMFGYGPTHTGYNPGETKVGVANVGTLVQLWSGSGGNSQHGPPAVANGTLFINNADGSLLPTTRPVQPTAPARPRPVAHCGRRLVYQMARPQRSSMGSCSIPA
jgi:outer membrane protein assembly factor BamB